MSTTVIASMATKRASRSLFSARPHKVTVYNSSIRRSFTKSAIVRLRTTELDGPALSGLQIDRDRLWDTIHSTARWTEPTGVDPSDIKRVGLKRLTLSKEDKEARDWFVSTTESLGCKTHVDQIGNIFAVRPGLNNDVPATFAGSHLDSQPSGGRFDGILGVAAGVEMLRTLNDNWIETEGPVGVVNWTNEEGAKYPISMMGSGVWSGRVGLQQAWDVKSVTAGPVTTVKEELERIGYLGSIPVGPQGMPIGAHFELHIEQGPKLEAAHQAIGVVEGVQAYKWFTVTITGRESHAGTTDFDHRADALYSASLFIATVREVAKSVGGLSTVGMLSLSPGSVNTVPGEVKLSLDIRHPSDSGLAQMLHMINASCHQISQLTTGDGKKSHLTEINFEMKEDFSSAAVKFHPDAVQCVEQAAAGVLNGSADLVERKVRRMTSGAGHDSVCTNMHCPTAMVFVPCKDGISHNPREWCEQEDCAVGANVLMHSVLRMDRLRRERGEFD
jgi:hydantoinase/carbamoylase family amidase